MVVGVVGVAEVVVVESIPPARKAMTFRRYSSTHLSPYKKHLQHWMLAQLWHLECEDPVAHTRVTCRLRLHHHLSQLDLKMGLSCCWDDQNSFDSNCYCCYCSWQSFRRSYQLSRHRPNRFDVLDWCWLVRLGHAGLHRFRCWNANR